MILFIWKGEEISRRKGFRLITQITSGSFLKQKTRIQSAKIREISG